MKYSIIIPCYNGMPYIKTCIETIISQNYNDYELIVSDDHSTDGTAEYIDSLVKNDYPQSTNISVLHCPIRMSMAEHWEWALSHATGEWQIFVGQDDGLQSYFFELADKLVEMADKNNVRTIMSERAYHFWPGCEFIYGDVRIGFNAKKSYKVLDMKAEAVKALTVPGLGYFDLPEMYTTSLFKKTLIDEAKSKQDGKLFTTHPQDANLAAIACAFEKKYLRSYVPLGWVGTSTKSAGMAVSTNSMAMQPDELEKLKQEYIASINTSALCTDKRAGSFLLASTPTYFWNALLMTENIQQKEFFELITSREFIIKIFSVVYDEIEKSNDGKKQLRMSFLDDVLKLNSLTKDDLIIPLPTAPVKKRTFLSRAYNKICRVILNISGYTGGGYSLYLTKNSQSNINLIEETQKIAREIRSKGII